MRGNLSAIKALIQDRFSEFAGRLDGDGPLGVAVSGGGDSVALLYALAAWGKRSLEVFCVDHGLNPLSPEWTQSVADHAARLGTGFTALYWRGQKPQSGLSAAARLARHRLLANAAREKGVSVLCLAHTADDIVEAEAMRRQGSNVGGAKPWSPSPVWPEGRDIFLCRPFLDIRREVLRDYLRGIGASWIDDPSNESVHSLRARTRKVLQASEPEATEEAVDIRLSPAQLDQILYQPETLSHLGLIAFDAIRFYALPPETVLKVLATAAVCAGGGERLPKREQAASLLGRLPMGKALNLSGARLLQKDGLILIGREAGDIGRNRPAGLSIAGGEGVWDGRFVVRNRQAGEIMASAALRAELEDDDRQWLWGLPEMARGSQPVFVAREEKAGAEGDQTKYLLTNPISGHSIYQRCLVMPRFCATMGREVRESDLMTVKNDCVLARKNGE